MARASMNLPQSEPRDSPTILRPEMDVLLDDPERSSIAANALNALRQYPWHAAIPLVVCLVLALVLATLRAPVYTAEAQLGIGRIDVSTYSIPGFVSASRDLAAAYSRALRTTAVTKPLARQVGTSPGDLGSRLSASPIPESPVIVVTAKGSSERDAVELANAAKTALIGYVTRLNRSNPDSARLLGAFERASLRLRNARAARAEARSSTGSARPEMLDQLDASIAKAELEVKTLNGLYQASQEGQAATDVIQVLSPASSARSDSRAFLQRLLFVGLIAGLVAGVGVALLRARSDISSALWR
jgi:capsular polysaccharide biosynthesis protein